MSAATGIVAAPDNQETFFDSQMLLPEQRGVTF
jgi:hypothetical protein